MFTTFLKHFRKLRMEFQVLIIILPIVLLITLVVALTHYLQYTVIFNMLKNQSTKLLTNQEYKAISVVAAELQKYIKNKHNFYISRLEHLNQIFSLVQTADQNYQTQNNLEHCIHQEDIVKNFIQYDAPQFCYLACGIEDRISLPKENKMIKIFNKTTQLINQFTIAMDATENTIISMVDFTDSVYFAAYPHIILLKSYDPKQRLWYKNHMEETKNQPNQNYFFSPVFKNYVKNAYQMSITYSILGKTEKNIGILNQNIELNDTNIIDSPYNIILSSENGEVILQGIESIQNLIYIKDYVLYINHTNQTGFNDSDWQKMKKVAQGQEIQDRCNQLNTHAFCLYNKYFNKSVIVNATLIKESGFYLIMQDLNFNRYSNITSQTILNTQLFNINNRIQSQASFSQYTLLISGIILLVMAIAIIHYIFLPLKDLMKTLYMYIKSRGNNINREIFKIFNTKRRTKSNNTFSDLMQVFLKFESKLNCSQQIKNKDCLYFEQLQYQQKLRNQLINPLELNLSNISNDCLTFCSIKNIFDLLKLKIVNL